MNIIILAVMGVAAAGAIAWKLFKHFTRLKAEDVFAMPAGAVLRDEATGTDISLEKEKWFVVIRVEGNTVVASKLWDHKHDPRAQLYSFDQKESIKVWRKIKI